MSEVSRAEALSAPSDGGVRQVVMTEPVWQAFVHMVYGRDLRVFRIPVDDGLPTYGVGPSDAAMKAMRRDPWRP